MTEAAFKAAMLESLKSVGHVSVDAWGSTVVTPEFYRIHEANFLWMHRMPKGGIAEALERMDAVLGQYHLDFRSLYVERDEDVRLAAEDLVGRGFRLIRNHVMVSARAPEITASPAVSVRPARDQATRDDHDAVAGLLHEEDGYDFEVSEQLSAIHWRRVAALGGEVYVAYLDGEPAGNAGLFVLGDTAIVYNVETAPAFRRKGVAATLVRHLMDRARERSVSTLALDTPSEDTTWRLYERLGFERVGSVVNFLQTQLEDSTTKTKRPQVV